MSKTLRKILTASSALLMIASVGATAGNTNVNARHRYVRTHHVYRHRRKARRRVRKHARKRAIRRAVRATWYKGGPKALGGNGFWLSNPYRIESSYYRSIKYERDVTPLGGKYGYNPIPFFFKANHRFMMAGSGVGADASVNPRTKPLGHGLYRVKSNGGTVTVKVYNRNRITIYVNGHYKGYFHRISRRDEFKFAYHPNF